MRTAKQKDPIKPLKSTTSFACSVFIAILTIMVVAVSADPAIAATPVIDSTTAVPGTVNRTGDNITAIRCYFTDTDDPDATTFDIIIKVRDTANVEHPLVNTKVQSNDSLAVVKDSAGYYTAEYTWDPENGVPVGAYDLYSKVDDNEGPSTTPTDDYTANEDELTLITSPTIDSLYASPNEIYINGSDETVLTCKFTDEDNQPATDFAVTINVQLPPGAPNPFTATVTKETDPPNTYTATYTWNPGGGDAEGLYDLIAEVDDANDGSDPVSALAPDSLTLIADNRPPTANADTYSGILEDASTQVFSVLDNDEDLDGDPLTIVSVGVSTPPTKGTVAIGSGSTTIEYTPRADSNGTDVFEYTISDGKATDAALVTVNITAQPDPPVALCLGGFSKTADTDACEASVAPAEVDSASYDPDGESVSLSLNPVGPFSVGQTSVWLVATSGADKDSCQTTITITDDQDPVASCPGDITDRVNDPGECGAVVNFTATVDDNCPGAGIVCNPASGSLFPVGTTTVTCTATDASGNTDVCTFDITVADTAKPVANCPGDISASNDPGACGAVVNFTATATDNCSGATVQCVPPSGSTFSVGVTTVTCTATDVAGNTSTCTFDVTVADTSKPDVTCPNDTTVECESDIPVPDPDLVTASDNCDVDTVVWLSDGSLTGGVCGGTITRTYRATDIHGNSAECTQVFTIDDTTPPMITCPDTLRVTCLDSIPDADTSLVETSDNCGFAVKVLHLGDTTLTDTCGIARIYSAIDTCGNADTCIQTIIIEDFEPPQIACPADTTVQCAGDVPDVNTADVDASDNCGSVEVMFFRRDVDSTLPNVKTITRTYLATDYCGNVDSCKQTITVKDTIPPEQYLPSDTVLSLDQLDACMCGATMSPSRLRQFIFGISPTDNCDQPGTISDSIFDSEGSLIPPEGFFFPVDEITPFTYIAVDRAGNRLERTVNVSFPIRTPVQCAFTDEIPLSENGQDTAIDLNTVFLNCYDDNLTFTIASKPPELDTSRVGSILTVERNQSADHIVEILVNAEGAHGPGPNAVLSFRLPVGTCEPVMERDTATTAEDTQLLDSVRIVNAGDTCDPSYLDKLGPYHGSLDSLEQGTGYFEYMPDNNFHGFDSILFSAFSIGYDSAWTVITVTPLNDPPEDLQISSPPSGTTVNCSGGETVTITCSFTDVDNPDAASFTAAFKVRDADGTEYDVNSVSYGGSDGSYQASVNWDPPEGQVSGAYAVICSIDDNEGSGPVTAEKADAFTVECEPPVDAVDDLYTLDISDNPYTRNATQGVLANDTPEGALTATELTDPDNLVTLNPDGSFTFTPATPGDYLFTYRATDNEGNFDDATCTMRVETPCDAPVATSTTVYMIKNTTYEGQLPFTAACGGAVCSKVSGPSHGTAAVQSGCTFTYTPSQNYLGEDSFLFRVTDMYDQTGTATIGIVVLGLEYTPPPDFGIRNADCAEDAELMADASLTLTNSGSTPFTISGLRIENDPDDEFSIQAGTLPFTLNQDDVLPVTVTYCSTNEGEDDADVVITYSTGQSLANGEVRLEGILQGEGASAEWEVYSKGENPSVLPLPPTQEGQTNQGYVYIKNNRGLNSQVQVRVDEAVFVDTLDVTPFQIDDLLPKYVDGIDSLTVAFSPQNIAGAVILEGDLILSGNAKEGDQTIRLFGQASEETWVVDDSALLRPENNCASHRDEFTIRNSAQPLLIESVLPSDPESFTLDGFTGAQQVVVGGQVTMGLTYTPNGAAGTRPASIDIAFHFLANPDVSIPLTLPVGSAVAYAPEYQQNFDESTLGDTVAIDETAHFMIAIENEGDAPLEGTCEDLDSPFQVVNNSCPFTVAARGTHTIEIEASSDRIRNIEENFQIQTNGFTGGCGSPASDEITLTLRVEDQLAPTFADTVPGIQDNYYYKEAVLNKRDTLWGSVHDQTNVDNVVLITQAGDAAPNDTAVVIAQNSPGLREIDDTTWAYRFIIGDSLTGLAGYQYRFVVFDNDRETATDWRNRHIQLDPASPVSRPSTPETGTIKKDGRWYMMSFPGLLASTSPKGLLENANGLSDDDNVWKVFPLHLANSQPNQYGRTSSEAFLPGRASWFRHLNENEEAVDLKLPAGYINPLQNQTETVFTINLNSGSWTMFSNPFPFDVYIPVNQAGLPSGATALLQGRPGGYANDGNEDIGVSSHKSDMEYLEDSANQVYAVLRPWVGYAIRSTAQTLVLNPHPDSDPNRWSTVSPVAAKGPGIHLTLSAGGAPIGEVLCGYSDQSADGWDPSDQPVLPLPRPAGVFYVMHDDWGDFSDRYTIDRRAPVSFHAVYPLGWSSFIEIKGGEYSLTAKSLDPLPGGQTVYLYDRARSVSTELQAGRSYSFRSELNRDDHRFVLIVGDEQFAREWTGQEEANRPTRYELMPNYPNPFNAGTVIEFHLTEYTHVTLDVFNVLGQKVRTLADRPMYPGVQRVEFDGTDDASRPLSTGVYFYRLTTELGSLSRKMVLLK